MKNMLLRDLRKKRKEYFRKIGIVRPGRKKEKTIEYIVERTYEALPSNLKKYIDNPNQIINVVTNMIIQGGKEGKLQPYIAIREYAKQRKRASGDNTKSFIFTRFRKEYPSLYSKYNSYVYRLGFSSSKYFMDNAEISQEGKMTYASLKLPPKIGGIIYQSLEIDYNFSDQEMSAIMY